MCLKLWAVKGKKICINCDNLVSVQVINQGKSRSHFLQACLRELCFICAVKECEVKAVHISAVKNRLPDLLSRWNISELYQTEFCRLTGHDNFTNISVNENLL